MYNKNTKIVCTLGPSSDSFSEIENLVGAGMNVARLNFSHGDYKDHKRILTNLRKVEKKTGKIIGVIQDLQGPKIRIGDMPKEGIQIKRGDEITLTTKKITGKNKGGKTIIPIQYKNIIKDVKTGETIFIDDGLIQLEIIAKTKTDLKCKVKIGGIVFKHKGVNCPNSSISAKTLTPKDKRDLLWGLKNKVDFVALSFVKSEKDIDELRKIIKKHRKNTKIIAKIERHEACENLEEIIKSADAIMVARGDLGIEIPAQDVPIVQKNMIHLANKYLKPVITATQVLQSMVENARATRAEISDAANAILDNTDAIMLSNETAVGKYPFRAAATLSKVAESVEKELQEEKGKNGCFVIYTQKGDLAKKTAQQRLFMPIITITPFEQTARELTLVRGLNKIYIAKFSGNNDKKTKLISAFLKRKNIKNPEIICE